MTSRRHHYTPRYYLTRFESPEGKLWRLDVETGKVVTGNNVRFGYKYHWNRLQSPAPGFEPDWAEKRIAEVDALSVLPEEAP